MNECNGKRGRAMSSSVRGTQKRKLISDKWRSGFEIMVLSAPAIMLFLGFVIFPVFMAAYYGFYQWKGFGSPSVNGKFVGLGNYVTILKDPAFQQAVGHNFFILIMSLVVQIPLGILFALLINQKMKGRALIRTLIFVPYVISEVIVGTGWSLILQTQGALNDLLGKIGIKGVDWISNPKIAIWTLIAIISWKYIGFYVILMLAGLQSIPEELYEAAKVDGASYCKSRETSRCLFWGRRSASRASCRSLALCSCLTWCTSFGASTFQRPLEHRPWRHTWFGKDVCPTITVTAMPSLWCCS